MLKVNARHFVLGVLSLSLAAPPVMAQAESNGISNEIEASGNGQFEQGEAFSPWLVHVDVAGVLMNESAKINVGGNRVPGASVGIENSPTVTFDITYFFTRNLAVNAFGGVPPRAVVKGAGSLETLGTLATAYYAPAVLSGEYHFTNFGRFQPYVGIGVNYTLFMNKQDRALKDVKIPDAFGAAFKFGFDYDLSDRWTAHFYVQQILLSTRVSAEAGGIPAVAKTTINPTLIGAGIGWRF